MIPNVGSPGLDRSCNSSTCRSISTYRLLGPLAGLMTASSFLFVPFQAHISAEFWQALSKRKIDQDKLSDHETPVLAHYSFPGRADAGAGSVRIDLAQDSFDIDRSSTNESCIARGFVRNTNTLEDFRLCDKNAFLEEASRRLWEDISSGAALAEPILLVSFALLCFADLKKYVYTYWMAHPVIPLSLEYASVSTVDEDTTKTIHDAVSQWRQKIDSTQWGFFVLDESTKRICMLSEYESISPQNRVFGYVDASSAPTAIGWSARNLLRLLLTKLEQKHVDLLCYRGTQRALKYNACVINAQGNLSENEMPKPTGWERNAAAKLGPRVVNLGAVMDPAKFADDAVDLNLKLMTWRIAPDLKLDLIKGTKCLLLGAGTLGCYVSRLLLGWGVRNITFVDSGRVSFSNPVRQSLYKFSDCLDQGKHKAQAAADALNEVYPGVNATGHKLSVPMIGHFLPDQAKAKEEYESLVSLIESHDAVFLLMDSRESRWLPTVICQALGKLTINAALGFDNYLVLRHGLARSTSASASITSAESLGCYFCNDVVQPGNSTMNQTLDQQCTVTRPGLAALASSTAVELLVSVLQHPEGAYASSTSEGHLGLVPHTVRGYLRSWETKVLTGSKYPNCSGCSDTVVEMYKKNGWDFVERACREQGWVEEISGLKAVQQGIEGIDLDWSSGEEE